MDPETQADDGYDALDEALMETFPASDPIAVTAPLGSRGAAPAKGSGATA